nr:hypothetical protein [Shewanella sp. ANA-3]
MIKVVCSSIVIACLTL